MSEATFARRGRNPDVLTCIANLSNDEVFTPPELANQMLDMVADAWAQSHDGASIWADPTVTFLDPFTKSGVFLRQITARLVDGLAERIPDLQERVDHILTRQVFGIAITELTALLARRSLYCSKWANSKHSIATSFETPSGNVWFERTEHTWVNGRCTFCGAAKFEYLRSADQETHAYLLLHGEDPQKLITKVFGAKMHFDVIVGNPPYQLSDGGGSGTSAAPIYQLFIEQAKKLEPRLLCMVTPSRWFSGGKGLDDFRERMLADQRLRVIEDYPDSSDVFPGVQIKGGVNFFLWDRDDPGLAKITTYDKGKALSTAVRPLLEPGADVFIRYNEAIPILQKVANGSSSVGGSLLPAAGQSFADLVSSRRPFGLDSTYRGRESAFRDGIKLYRAGGTDYVAREVICKFEEAIDEWKVFIPFLASGSDSFPHPILGKPFIGEPGSACTETYLVIGPFEGRTTCENVISYIHTRLFRFIVLQKKPSQNATRKVYEFLPKLDFSRSWSDEDLYLKYGISETEITFIESMIRPMDLADD